MDWRHIGELLEAGGSVYDEMLNLVTWVKSNAGQGSFYRSQHDPSLSSDGPARRNAFKPRKRPQIGGYSSETGKRRFAQDCVVGLAGLELRARHAVLSNRSL
jgi:hypothetical protein